MAEKQVYDSEVILDEIVTSLINMDLKQKLKQKSFQKAYNRHYPSNKSKKNEPNFLRTFRERAFQFGKNENACLGIFKCSKY